MIQDPILYLVAESPPVSDHSISPLLSAFRIFWQEGHRVPWMNEDALVGTSDWDIPNVIVCLNQGSLTLVAWQSTTFLLPHRKVTVLSFVTGKYPGRQYIEIMWIALFLIITCACSFYHPLVITTVVFAQLHHSFYLCKIICLFIWLCWDLVAACGIF